VKWRTRFHNEKRGIPARYNIDAPLSADAVRLDWKAVLGDHPPTPRRGRPSLFEQTAERIGGQHQRSGPLSDREGQRARISRRRTSARGVATHVMKRRPRKLPIGLFGIVLPAISVIQFRSDKMTTRHSLAVEPLLEPAKRDRSGRTVRPANRELARSSQETSPADGRLSPRPNRLVSAPGAIVHDAGLQAPIRMCWT
jgi:hypothetical protein